MGFIDAMIHGCTRMFGRKQKGHKTEMKMEATGSAAAKPSRVIAAKQKGHKTTTKTKSETKLTVTGAEPTRVAASCQDQCQYRCLIGLSGLPDCYLSNGEKNQMDLDKKKLRLVINVDNNTLFRWMECNHIELRPHARKLIKNVSEMYDITLYTKTDSISHLQTICSSLDPDGLYLNNSKTFLIDHTTTSNWEGGHRLDSLMVDKRDLLVIDVKEDGWENYLRNLFTLAPYGVDVRRCGKYGLISNLHGIHYILKFIHDHNGRRDVRLLTSLNYGFFYVKCY